MDLPSLVSTDWLHKNLDHPDLVVLDATLAKPKSSITDIKNHDLQISGAQYFDIDNKFSDKSYDLPHMMCDAGQFQKEAGSLGINNDSLVVVYDQHGVYSSPRAWWMIKSMGHKNVAVLNGGLPDWIEKQYPTEKKKSTDGVGDFQPKNNDSCFVDANFVLETIDDENIVVLDARSKGRFDGTEPEPRAGLRGGHIPNSISLPFPEVLHGTKMKSKDELQQILSPLGLEGKRLVFSCGSGLTACIILFATHLAGYENLSVYDGSWTEWGQKEELLVVKT